MCVNISCIYFCYFQISLLYINIQKCNFMFFLKTFFLRGGADGTHVMSWLNTVKGLPVRSLCWSGCDRASPDPERSYRPGTAAVLQSPPRLQKMGFHYGTLTQYYAFVAEVDSRLLQLAKKYNCRWKDDVKRVCMVCNTLITALILCCAVAWSLSRMFA